ncbi:MAG: NADP-dependent isocitrate dehydrogenase [Thermodesulfobacteriota bacterium]
METKKVYFIEGDGVGPEVMRVARLVLDRAVQQAYAGQRQLLWEEVLAGEKARQKTGHSLPKDSLLTLREKADVALKGPLTTPVGSGFRSLNVALRQMFDLFACIRPIRYFPGVASPLRCPELVDMVVFRENTEDVYAGIEWEAESLEAGKVIAFLREELGVEIDPAAALGLKPMTESGSKRLVRKAIEYGLKNNRRSVTLVHKGNIMKYTEGGFRKWGYELAAQEFGDKCVREEQAAQGGKRLVIKDRIADNMFQQTLISPRDYDLIATSNLNGDYLSDALAAQVGGLGLAPGANIGDSLALFEATHGTAPDIAGRDRVNPSSLILSGGMLLEHLGWDEAATITVASVEQAIREGKVTADLARARPGSQECGCREFGDCVCGCM